MNKLNVEFTEQERQVLKVVCLKVGRDVMTHSELRDAYQATFGKVAAPAFITKNPMFRLRYHGNEIRGCYYLPIREIPGELTAAQSDSILMARAEFIESVVAGKEERALAAA